MRTGRKLVLKALWILPYLVAAAFWWQHTAHSSSAGNMFSIGAAARWTAIGSLAGLWTATAALLQLVLIGRVKWLETIFGFDRMTLAHRYNAIALFIFLVLHVSLVTYGHSLNNIPPLSLAAQFKDFALKWEDLGPAAVGAALLLVVGISSVPLVRHRLPYEVWYYAHLIVYAAIVLAFGHQFLYGIGLTNDVANRTFFWYWVMLYVFCIGNLVIYRFVLPLVRFARYRYTVDRIEQETNDVTSVYIGGCHLEKLPAHAGQFVLVRFLAKGFRWQSHPFSLSRPPDGGPLRLSIKNVGGFTAAIPHLKPGTRVLVDGPHGIFTAAQAAQSKILLIAGGIGITPIRALAEDLACASKKIVLLYANRDAASVVFRAELRELQRLYPNLHVTYVLSRKEKNDEGECGYIDEEKLRRLVPDIAERDVFLCGPPPMILSLRPILRTMGVPTSRLHDELFRL